MAGRGLVVLQLQLRVRSWLLLVPPRRLVSNQREFGESLAFGG